MPSLIPTFSTNRPARRQARSGLTVVEVIIAMLVFSVGGLGLAASSAVIVRQMAASERRMRSQSIARKREEMLHASPCGVLPAGEETESGIRSVWHLSTGATTMTLEQELTRSGMSANRTDRYMSAVPCE